MKLFSLMMRMHVLIFATGWVLGPVWQGQGAGTGLNGEYFGSNNFTTLKFTRTDATVNFDWGTNTPGSGVGADNFSVRWSGQIEPRFTETYTFYVTADDGARLWVNDRMILGRTVYSSSALEVSGKIALKAGEHYNIVLEYNESTGQAKVRLGWSSPSQAKEIIPQSQLYPTVAVPERGSLLVEHWLGLPGTNLSALTADTNYPAKPDMREFITSFECLQPNWADSYGTRVTGYIMPSVSGNYVFTVSGDDTVELRLSTDTNAANKRLIASVPAATGFRQFTNFSSQVSTSITLVALQKYYVELLHKEDTNSDHFSVAWQPPGATNFTVIPGDVLIPAGLHTTLPTQANIFNTLVPVHPRLLASPEKFEWLRQAIASNSNTQITAWWKTLSNSAAGILTSPINVYTQDNRGTILNVSRSVLDRMQKLGLVWQITGDTNFSERAWAELAAVAAYPDWHPAHYLDTAEMTHAFAIGYDWMYNYWSQSRRDTIRNAIITNGLNQSLNIYTNMNDWSASTANNWNLVCNGGMIMGALAVGTENESLAEYIVLRAVTSATAVMKHYTADNGGWYEGPGYWDYTTDYNTRLMAALESALGTDFGLSDTKTAWETGLFAMGMVGPNKLCFNFADAGAGNMAGPQLFWVSRRYNRPEIAWYQRTNASPEVLDLLWYDARGSNQVSSGIATDFHYRGPTGTTSFSPADAVTLRTRWSDPDATFVGFKSGEIGASHGHLDGGSFVLDALGRRWAHDMGGDDYALPGYFSIPQRWTYYRLRAEGHNTLVINPDANADQNTGAKPPVILFETEPNPERSALVADLTSAYDITRVWRGIQLFNQRRWVLVQDELQATNATVWWFMHIQTNEAPQLDLDGSAAMLTQGTDRLWVKILSGGGTFVLSNAVPLPTSPQLTNQNANATMQKLAIKLTGVTNTTLAVLMVPLNPGDNPPTQLPTLTPLTNWGAINQFAPLVNATNVKAGPAGFVDVDLLTLATDAQTASSNLLFTVSGTNGTAALFADGHTVRFTQPSNALAPLIFTYTATDQVEDSRLLFHYTFDPPVSEMATNVTDNSGHYRDGMLDKLGTGSFAYDTNVSSVLAPFSAQSLRLTASGTNAARLSLSLTNTDYNLSDADWTFTTWFRRASTNTDDFLFYIGAGDGYGGTGDELQLYCPANQSTLGLGHWNATNGQNVGITSTNTVNLGEWHHAAVVFNRTATSNGTIRLYLDGAQAGSVTNLPAAFAQSAPLRFGGHYATNYAVDRWLDGNLDDVALFGAALSATDIAKLASGTVAQFGGRTSTGLVTVLPWTLPFGWLNQDIGSVGVAGNADYFTNTFVVTGSGADIYNSADAFQFVFQQRAGDGAITARVLSQDPTDPWAKAGVMIRETLDAGARNACTVVTPSNGIAFQRRVITNGTSATTSGPRVTAPYWVRMARSGTNLIGSASADATNWTQVTSVAITNLADPVYWGLAVSAHNITKTCTALFDNVTLNATPVFPSLADVTMPPGGSLIITNTATDSDLPLQTLSYSLLTPPVGASIDPLTGVINWTPLQSGTFKITTKVTDNGVPALSATNSFNVTVNPFTNTTIYFWDTSASTGLQAGSGTWDTAISAWSATPAGSNPLLAWPVGGGGAVFAGANGSYLIATASGLTVDSLIFSNAGYSVTGSALNHFYTPLSIRTEADATINVPLAGGYGLVKDGAGKLVLGGASTFAGNATINAGTLQWTTDNALPATAAVTIGSTNGTAGNLDLNGHGQTISGLAFKSITTNYDTVKILGGNTLTVSNIAAGIAFGVGNYGNTIGGITATTRVAFAGGGSLIINAPSGAFSVEPSGTNATGNALAVLDLSGLSNFTANVSNWTAAVIGGNPNNVSVQFTLTLATNNTITATNIVLGSSGMGNSSAGGNTVNLGRSNTFNANNIVVMGGRQLGAMLFQAGSSSNLTIRGVAGGSSRANLYAGDQSNLSGLGGGGGSSVSTSTLNFSGATVDVRFNQLTLGIGGSSAGGYGTAGGTFIFSGSNSIVDVNNVILGYAMKNSAWGSSNSNAVTHTGTLIMNAGTLIVNSNFFLGYSTDDNLGTTQHVTGVFTLNGGIAMVTSNIFLGYATNTAGTNTGILNLSNGTLNVSADILSASANATGIVNLVGATLNMNGNDLGSASKFINLVAGSGTLQSVGEINAGATPLVKTSTGTLILSNANNHTGGTILGGGTLVLAGSLNSSLTATNGLLTGGGMINGNLTLNAGTTNRVNINGFIPNNGYDQLVVTGAVSTVTLAGALNIVAATNLPDYVSFTIINNAGTLPVNGTFAGLPEGAIFSASGYWWRINYASGDGNDVVLSLLTATNRLPLVSLVTTGAVWKYLDNDSDQGAAWRSNTFNDAGWNSGPAKLGFGVGSEATIVNGGPTTNRYVTTYFRRAFYVPDATLVKTLGARLLRNDGAVVYLNGGEVWRDGLPVSTNITYRTLATQTIQGTNQTNYISTTLTPSVLITGTNVVAVEVHQVATNSPDLGFDFELTTSVVLDRVPMLAISRAGSGNTLTIPLSAGFLQLYSATNLAPPYYWMRVTNSSVLTNGSWQFTLPYTSSSRRFLRLQSQ
ncbi:MAG: PA14 domain-containing protein [Verrucomicrobiota bacterium]